MDKGNLVEDEERFTTKKTKKDLDSFSFFYFFFLLALSIEERIKRKWDRAYKPV